jgi:hypothetical protein
VTVRRALLVVVIAGVAIFALSFVSGWIVHDREIRGEGFRHSETLLNAWRSIAIPVLTLAAIISAGTAAAALTILLRPGILPSWILAAGSVAVVALVASSLVPLSWDGFTTSIDLRPGLLTAVGLILALAMLVAAWRAAEIGRGAVVPFVIAGLVVGGAAVGGRSAILVVGGPSNQNWDDGTYVRAGDDLPPLTLTIEAGAYRIDDRWSGRWEGSGGWTIAIDGDPACPDARGAYHAHGEGEDQMDLRFVKIVDTCRDGERAADLESGIWVRQP